MVLIEAFLLFISKKGQTLNSINKLNKKKIFFSYAKEASDVADIPLLSRCVRSAECNAIPQFISKIKQSVATKLRTCLFYTTIKAHSAKKDMIKINQ